MALDPADVLAWLGVDETDVDAAVLARVCAAVDDHAARHYDLTDPTDEHDLALIMQGGRLYRRRYSPDGISGADDLAPIRVHTFDGDVQRMLAGRLLTAGIFGPSANVVTEEV